MLSSGAGWDFLGAFALVVILLPVLIRLAPRIGLVDAPSERKRHRGSVPLVGGLAVFIALAAVLLARHAQAPGVAALLAAGTLLVGVGVADDRAHIHPRWRFLFQIAACVLMILGAGVVLDDFGQLLGPFTAKLGWFALPVTVFCVVGATNATNMIDGMDGLSAGMLLVALAGLAGAAILGGAGLGGLPELPVLAGALLAYGLFNLRLPGRPRALTFFGDAGTLLTGFVLAWLLVRHSQGPGRIIAPVTALWLFAVPLIDTVFLMIERARHGHGMTEADRRHLHHAFLRSGWSVNATLLALLGAATVMAAAGLLLLASDLAEYVAFYIFMSVCGMYYLAMRRAWATRRFLGRPIV